MKYTTEQLRLRRQNRQIAVREMHPEWDSETVYRELKRKWGIPRGSAIRDWYTIRAEMAQASEEQNNETA